VLMVVLPALSLATSGLRRVSSPFHCRWVLRWWYGDVVESCVHSVHRDESTRRWLELVVTHQGGVGHLFYGK
jgi:hypothetical protein